MSRVVTLALREFLEIPNHSKVKEATLDELAK